MSEAPIPGAETFRWAALAEKFHLAPADIGALTDAQLHRLYFHPRDKDGALVPPSAPAVPAGPPTAETRLASVAQLEALGLISAARANELRAEVQRG